MSTKGKMVDMKIIGLGFLAVGGVLGTLPRYTS
jgi:hypothetical protein